MELIASFSVDHRYIVPGIFTSRIDTVGDSIITTYDIRLTRPNKEPAIDAAAMHSLEHIIATFLRNDPQWKDEVIYWGPVLRRKYMILFSALSERYKPIRAFPALRRKTVGIIFCTISEWQNGMQKDLQIILKKIPATILFSIIRKQSVLSQMTDSISLIHK